MRLNKVNVSSQKLKKIDEASGFPEILSPSVIDYRKGVVTVQGVVSEI